MGVRIQNKSEKACTTAMRLAERMAGVCERTGDNLLRLRPKDNARVQQHGVFVGNVGLVVTAGLAVGQSRLLPTQTKHTPN